MFQVILGWSEAWVLLIPLAAYLLIRQQPNFFKPVLIYICGALFLNVVGDVIADFKRYLPGWMQTNLVLYNVHSFFRFACFIGFFRLVPRFGFVLFRIVLLMTYITLVLLNYLFLENYFDKNAINGNLFTIEAYFLLIYCLLYYLSQLRDETEDFRQNKEFWIVTGLSIYVVINFFMFLFYVPMIQQNELLAEKMWSVHNMAYILLCLFITKAIYVPLQPDYRV